MALITDRLIIKPLTAKDNGFIDKLVNTSEWSELIGAYSVNSDAELTAYIETIINNPDNSYWVIRIRKNGIPVGIIKRDYLAHYDIGTAFLPGYKNKGYGYEAVKAMLQSLIYCAENSHVLSISKSANYTALKLLKKGGVKFDKEIEVENRILHVYSFSTDKLVITEIISSFFEVFNNKKNRLPNGDLLKNVCISETRIINKQGTSHKAYNLDLFIQPVENLLADGTVKEFEEKEIYKEAKIIASIAQGFAENEKKGIMEGRSFRQHHYTLFQLIKTNSLWKIYSVR